MFDIWLPLIGGLFLLILGGDLLVRGAVRVAASLGISPLVIGLTLVGFGTSTPELVTSVQAALSGAPGIAYGNILGSNMANILLIGGLSALLFPIAVSATALKRDGTVMLAATAVMVAVAMLMPLTRPLGLGLLGGLALYLWLVFRQEKAAPQEIVLPTAEAPARRGPALLLALAGLVLVVLGGRFLVSGAVELALSFGLSESLIGLTIVAVGTSLPELVTSIVAGLRRQGEVAFGNIVGSNIYNILGIAGTTALLSPGPVPADLAGFDAPLVLVVSLLFLALAWTGRRIGRGEGALLLAGYAAYLAFLWP